MILFFSATGNTEFVARECARLLDDECINLLSKIKNNDFSPIHSERPFIICAPIYVCEIPNFVNRFLKRTPLTGCRDVYFIFTSGGYSGCASVLAKWFCRRKKLKYKGSADIIMPRNYIANDIYPMQDTETIKKQIADGSSRIPEVVSVIKNGGVLKKRHVFIFELLIILPVEPLWVKFKMTAKAFYVKDNCIGCGKCEKLCPLNNITIKDKRPVWGGECTHCMACIANCPKESIEYAQMTQGKERYLFKKYANESTIRR